MCLYTCVDVCFGLEEKDVEELGEAFHASYYPVSTDCTGLWVEVLDGLFENVVSGLGDGYSVCSESGVVAVEGCDHEGVCYKEAALG